jgi:hypothetical protein
MKCKSLVQIFLLPLVQICQKKEKEKKDVYVEALIKLFNINNLS